LRHSRGGSRSSREQHAGRGGRTPCVRLAREGADIIAVDICADIPSMDFPNA
jgi:hypothetical protein